MDEPPHACRTQTDRRGRRRRRWESRGGEHVGGGDREGGGAADRAEEQLRDAEVALLEYPECGASATAIRSLRSPGQRVGNDGDFGARWLS